MPRKKRSTVTDFANKRLNKLYKEKNRNKSVKTLTDEEVARRNVKKQESRTRLKEANLELFRKKNNHTQSLYVARKKDQLARGTTNLQPAGASRQGHISFSRITNGKRVVKYANPESGLKFNLNIFTFPRGSCEELKNLIPITTEKRLRMKSTDVVFQSERFEGDFEQLMQVLNYSSTPNSVVDTYLELVLRNPDGWIPLAFYTHFIGTQIRAVPDLTMLSKRLLSKKRIFVPAHMHDGSIAHVYLAVIHPKTNTVDIYDSLRDYTSSKNKENHLDKILDEIYKEAKVDREHYEINHKRTPQQNDVTSCSIYVLFITSCLMEGKTIPKSVSQNQLDIMRQTLHSKLLVTTEIGKQILKLILE